ncbi:MAG: TolC family protein, partial [Deltaproteobacteria bacterium]|nr:TolC family protein [Deltaproteobacteria bacterium]
VPLTAPPIAGRRSIWTLPRAGVARRSGAALLALLGASALAAPALRAEAAAEALSLQAYVTRVLEGGLEARAAPAWLEVAAAEHEAAGLWPNPSLALARQANAAGARSGESQDEARLAVPLPLSGRRGLLREAAARDLDAAGARLSFTRAALRHLATAAYLEAAAAERRVAVEEAALAALEPVVAAVSAREKAGEAAGYERVRMELETRRLEDAVSAATLERGASARRARALLGAEEPSAPRFATDALELAMGAPPANAATAVRGDARALAAEAEAARLEEEAGWRALIPEPTLEGGAALLDLGQAGAGWGYAVGIELPLPLFDHGQGERARARARLVRVEAEDRALRHARAAALDNAMAMRAARAERLSRHDREVRTRARELLDITSAAYRAGSAELLALVDAERAFREAELGAVELRLEARQAENDLLLLAGSYDDAPLTR